jgi:hypothetical protein
MNEGTLELELMMKRVFGAAEWREVFLRCKDSDKSRRAWLYNAYIGSDAWNRKKVERRAIDRDKFSDGTRPNDAEGQHYPAIQSLLDRAANAIKRADESTLGQGWMSPVEVRELKQSLAAMTKSRDTYAEGFSTQSRLHSEIAQECEAAQAKLSELEREVAALRVGRDEAVQSEGDVRQILTITTDEADALQKAVTRLENDRDTFRERCARLEVGAQKACGMATQGYLASLNTEYRDKLMEVSDVLREALAGSDGGEVGWMPIKTAPKDGTRVLLTVSGCEPAAGMWLDPRPLLDSYIGYLPPGFEDGHWISFDPEGVFEEDAGLISYLIGTEYKPTHWQPLPPTPEPATIPAGERTE